ncbi:MAG: transcription termination/antitermination factor NusG [Chloroflexi bacterium]|nr:transcription termination/antitermination factor NusG [Chloroflexota bacterium]
MTTAETQPTKQINQASDPDVRWYVVHTYSGYEERVKKNLQHRIETMDVKDRVFEIVVPEESIVELRDGQRRERKVRVYPGYILVRMTLDEKSWFVVRNTPGVTGFVSAKDAKDRDVPIPLTDEEAKAILKQIETETPRIKVGFAPGQTVRIREGPFVDFIGTVDQVYPDKGKVRVLVSFFGRETPVELDFLQVEKQ